MPAYSGPLRALLPGNLGTVPSEVLTFTDAFTWSGVQTFGSAPVPTTDDGAALGTTALKWSDLFLASGAVINFNSGDVTITHSANSLAVAGGTSYTFDADVTPDANDSGQLGVSGTAWSDLFLASGAVINFAAANVTITHATGTLTFDGAAVVFNEASADLDFRIESNDNANMFVLDAGLNSIGIGGAAASGQTLVVTNATAAATGRVLKLSGTFAAAALTDGYGAFEVDITLSGSPTDHSAAASAWVNITGGTVPVGTYICARNDGIYEATAATITNAKLIFGARMHYLADDTDGLRFPFSLNTNNVAITALFDCQNRSDFGLVASAGTAENQLLPIMRDSAGNLRYIMLYTN